MKWRWAVMGCLILGLLVLFPVHGRADPLKVGVVLSDNSVPYLAFAQAFNQDLPATIQSSVLKLEQWTAEEPPMDLLIAVGLKAAEAALLQTHKPLLAVMIPQAGFAGLITRDFPSKATRPVSAIYLDQPLARRINFLRTALPQRRRIGLLHSAGGQIEIARLRRILAQRGATLVEQQIGSVEELFPKLSSILSSSDVLFTIADEAIYSSSTIRNILLASYEQGIPLFGHSMAYVNAGALAAVFSTPEQLAMQARTVAMSFVQNGRLPDPQYPVDYTIALNQPVARSLEIELPSQEAIRKQMDKAYEEGQ